MSRQVWQGIRKMATIPHNIESAMSKWNNARNLYRCGYSNLGLVYIYGRSGSYQVHMGDSAANIASGINGLHVHGNLRTLADVSRVIENLELREVDGRKTVWFTR